MNPLTAAFAFSMFGDGNGLCMGVIDEKDLEKKFCFVVEGKVNWDVRNILKRWDKRPLYSQQSILPSENKCFT